MLLCATMWFEIRHYIRPLTYIEDHSINYFLCILYFSFLVGQLQMVYLPKFIL
jgi:hypothetical protein